MLGRVCDGDSCSRRTGRHVHTRRRETAYLTPRSYRAHPRRLGDSTACGQAPAYSEAPSSRPTSASADGDLSDERRVH